MAFLKGSFMAAQMAHVTVRCAAATVLGVHLEEPALNIHVLSYELSQGLVELNQRRGNIIKQKVTKSDNKRKHWALIKAVPEYVLDL